MSRRFFGGTAVALVLSLIGISWYQAEAQARTEDKPLFVRLIGPQTLVFQHARVSEWLKTPFLEEVFKQMPDMREQMLALTKKEFGIALSDMDTVTVYLDTPQTAGGAVAPPRPPYVLIQAKIPFDAEAARMSVGENAKTIQFGKYAMTAGSKRGVALLNDRTMLIFNFDGLESAENAAKNLLMYFAALETGMEIPEGLKPAVTEAMTSKHIAVTGFQVPKELGAMLQEQLKNLPPMMTPFKPLAQIQSGVMTFDYVAGVENDFQMKIQGRFPDAGAANAGMSAARFAIAAGKMAITSLPNREADMKPIYDFLIKQLDMMKLETKDQDLVLDYQTNLTKLVPIFTTALERVRNAANRMLSASNMRQLIIGMHNYHSDFNKMPEVMTMKNGKPMHSWRVMLLPYLEGDNILKQVKLDEPWDSEANKKFFESIPMPKIYAHPGKKDGDSKMTYYKVFYSKNGVKPSAGFSLGKPTTLAQMVDGTSNTIAMIEAGPPVLWYKPDDIEFDPTAPLPKLVSPWKNNQVNIGLFDGSIRTVWLGTDEDTWKALITANGGEVVDFSKVEEKK